MKIKTTFFALCALFILLGNSLALASFYPWPSWPGQPNPPAPSEETTTDEPSGETTSGEGSR